MAAGLWLARGPAPAPSGPAAGGSRQRRCRRPRYVDNAQCVGCHQAAGEAWAPSHHAKAMAPPTPQTVRGNFDNTQFRHQGVTTRFFRRGDRYMVHTDGPDGRMADFEVTYTFGVEPLQQYLIETGNGRLQPLQIAWNTRDGKWFHLLPNEKAPPGDVLHWTGRYQTGQHDVHRLPHHRLREALRRQGRRLRLALDRSERVLPVLPWPGLAACRMGPAQGRRPGGRRRSSATAWWPT